MQYRIRKAQKKDLKNITDLAVSMVKHSVSPFREVKLDEAKQFRKDDLKSLELGMGNPNLGIFIAEEIDGTFIGHVISMANFTESSTGENQGYVFDLAVHDKYRRLGIGKNLMDTAEEFCKKQGMKYMALNVTVSNTSAVDFYEDLGYLVERKRMMKKLEK